MTERRLLLVASNFPPVLGGSASVYANLAQFAPDRILVLAPSVDYLDGTELEGWRAHDARAPYRVFRLPLLRTIMRPGRLGGVRRVAHLASDLLIRLRVLAVVVWLIAVHRVRTVCLGELLSFGWLARLLRPVPGVTVVAYVHGEEITTVDNYDPDHGRARRAMADSDVTVVVSSFTRRAVDEVLGPGHGKRVETIQNGVNKLTFFPSGKDPALVARYGLAGCFTFVSVCRLVEKKGIDHAIRAFATLGATERPARFLVVGAGPDEARLRAIAAEAGVADRVVFAGRVADEELADHYRLGDVFVMPNRRLPDGDTEGFGLVFLEANRCGLPVIAGCDGGSTDAVQDGLNGLVVNGHSVPDIAAAMGRLAGDPALYRRLREGGLARSDQAGWDEKARALLHVTLGRADGEAPMAPARPAPGLAGFLLVWALCLPALLLALPYLLMLRVLSPSGAVEPEAAAARPGGAA